MGTGDLAGQSALARDPLLASAARALNESKQWGYVVDAAWQVVFISDEANRTFGWDLDLPTPALGTAWSEASLASPVGPNTVEMLEAVLTGLGGMMVADLGRRRVEDQIDPRLASAVAGLDPTSEPIVSFSTPGCGFDRRRFDAWSTAVRVRDENGRLAGTVVTTRPAAGAATVGLLLANNDLGHLDRILQVTTAARRPAAILFADLDGSAPMARRLSTANYFSLNRRLVRLADQCAIAAGGLVGQHAGDGVAAFFLAEQLGSESTTARACIEVARAIRDGIPAIAEHSGLEPHHVSIRMGLHWAATPYVGTITSSGRSEATAFGTEVNQAARIEASAVPGCILASKDLVERLDPDDAAALGIEIDQVSYTALADWPSATEKARRDAPAVSICEI